MEDKVIKMEHGAGGELMQNLIKDLIIKNIEKKEAGGVGLDELDDGGSIPLNNFRGNVVLTTDSHIVKPLFFPGGDIGKLAVSGTVNDLSVMGAKPVALSSSIVVEEGFDMNKIEEIMKSINKTSKEADTPIITGDTKVMEKEEISDLIINTTGIGFCKNPVRDSGLNSGDKLIITGPIGRHGISLLSFREGFTFESDLESDVQPINSLIDSALKAGGVTAMKDPTRGGLATALNEMASKSNLGLLIKEDKIPLTDGVESASSILGIDPMNVANEGIAIIGVKKNKAEDVLSELKKQKKGKKAKIIGKAVKENKRKVVLETKVGGKRFLEAPDGDPVPRVC
ncbi:MAG: Hydrogenase maturation factor HypE [Candidatus Methanohalarchaeum thermophilum]|uniref:Hydrogenase maturation factor HypE n=1 Tax=Methanohalarchaeum thermophilum TaxID=1903181 RepID=A0A1Q6DS09_METT1|nr:MAG: Hydrogenase maturation factor HypE [Candidatus Methanohalarchaeum thermophilum]